MFNPMFDFIAPDYQLAADIINRPHEDYPNRVNATAEAIKKLHATFYVYGPVTNIDNILGVHKHIMADTHHAGMFRQCQVTIGSDRGMDYWEVPSAISRTEVVLSSEMLMREWYKAFQQIHPFEDGNGRVGGAIIAAASILYFADRIMVPLC